MVAIWGQDFPKLFIMPRWRDSDSDDESQSHDVEMAIENGSTTDNESVDYFECEVGLFVLQYKR